MSTPHPAPAPTPTMLHGVRKCDGETTRKHIVMLKPGASKAELLAKLSAMNADITHDWDFINAFAGRFDGASLNAIRSAAGVQSIEENGVSHVPFKPIKRGVQRKRAHVPGTTQTDAPWGIARISSKKKLEYLGWHHDLEYKYEYDPSAGRGVDVYVLDSGVRSSHQEFKPNRVTWGHNFIDDKQVDVVGHGTHIAGTIAGHQFGVAKAANIIVVKIVSDSGTTDDILKIDAFHYVYKEMKKDSTRPSIVSLSAHSPASQSLDRAVNEVIDLGVHVVVSAGNHVEDCSTFSPGHLPRVICVTASDIEDKDGGASYGSTVAVYAPGLDITSADCDSDNGHCSLSGTSMATPHVAGLVAYLLGLEPEKKISPAEMKTKVQDMALKGVLDPKLMPPRTVNYLIHNGFALPSK